MHIPVARPRRDGTEMVRAARGGTRWFQLTRLLTSNFNSESNQYADRSNPPLFGFVLHISVFSNHRSRGFHYFLFATLWSFSLGKAPPPISIIGNVVMPHLLQPQPGCLAWPIGRNRRESDTSMHYFPFGHRSGDLTFRRNQVPPSP